jgi:hypothetical protein
MQRHHHDPEVTTGRPAVNLISRILSHLTIVLASVLVVLFLIDQAKRGEMSFLANQTTKWMLFALALLSIADRDKGDISRLADALGRAGYRLAATPGTAAALVRAGHAADPVAKLGAPPDAPGQPILELIASGRVGLVVNTPTPRSGAVRDAADIRHAAVAEGVLCLTAMETAVAAAEALDPAIRARLAEVRSLQDWVPGSAVWD